MNLKGLQLFILWCFLGVGRGPLSPGARYRRANRKKLYSALVVWRNKNRKRRNATARKWHAKNMAVPEFRIKNALRTRVRLAVKKGFKASKTLKLIGCTVTELRTHLEKQFLPGMSWENYGMWHIDHRRPCASFDLTAPEQQIACFHFSNLQPLWAIDNLKKGVS